MATASARLVGNEDAATIRSVDEVDDTSEYTLITKATDGIEEGGTITAIDLSAAAEQSWREIQKDDQAGVQIASAKLEWKTAEGPQVEYLYDRNQGIEAYRPPEITLSNEEEIRPVIRVEPLSDTEFVANNRLTNAQLEERFAAHYNVPVEEVRASIEAQKTDGAAESEEAREWRDYLAASQSHAQYSDLLSDGEPRLMATESVNGEDAALYLTREGWVQRTADGDQSLSDAEAAKRWPVQQIIGDDLRSQQQVVALQSEVRAEIERGGMGSLDNWHEVNGDRLEVAVQFERHADKIHRPLRLAEEEISRSVAAQLRDGKSEIDLSATYATGSRMAAGVRHEQALERLQPLIEYAQQNGIAVNAGEARMGRPLRVQEVLVERGERISL